VLEQFAALLHASVAVHVLVVEYVPAHAPGVVTSTNVTAGAASQSSVTVGAIHTGAAGQFIGVVCAAHVTVGGVTSCTTIVTEQLSAFVHASVAVHVLVVDDVPAHGPAVTTSTKVTAGAASHASTTVGAIHTGAAGQSINVACAAHVIVGGVISCTTIVLEQSSTLPQSSVAVHVLVTENVPVHGPAVVTSAKVMTGAGAQLSVAVAATQTGVAGQFIGVV